MPGLSSNIFKFKTFTYASVCVHMLCVYLTSRQGQKRALDALEPELQGHVSLTGITMSGPSRGQHVPLIPELSLISPDSPSPFFSQCPVSRAGLNSVCR